MTGDPVEDTLDRDGRHCVACDVPLDGRPRSVHHRILGNRSDNRPSNLISLCGSGTTACHGVRVHGASDRRDPRRGRHWAFRLGYRISRHADRRETRDRFVWYQQPSLGRVGWYQITDDGLIDGPVPIDPPAREDLP